LNGRIQTVTRRLVDPLNLRPEDIDLVDVVRALSNQCRYGGQLERFYSVAQHSLLVCDECIREAHRRRLPWRDRFELAWWGLMHDAAEAYLVDLPTPVKSRMLAYEAAEAAALAAIAEKLGLRWPMPDFVVEADHRVLASEMRCLRGDADLPYEPVPEITMIVPIAPDEACRRMAVEVCALSIGEQQAADAVQPGFVLPIDVERRALAAHPVRHLRSDFESLIDRLTQQ